MHEIAQSRFLSVPVKTCPPYITFGYVYNRLLKLKGQWLYMYLGASMAQSVTKYASQNRSPRKVEVMQKY